jgi:hypothetical protein
MSAIAMTTDVYPATSRRPGSPALGPSTVFWACVAVFVLAAAVRPFLVSDSPAPAANTTVEVSSL